ncbi:MAG TPA: NAD(P)H-binding protein [Verrucomicrobiae bacterium]|nr:NAD(P)H-binding protein [Verrucomicrobiae bacterium]
MSATIAIVGANGVYARHLIPHLTAENFKVRALVRRIEAAGVARACGADVRVADIFDPTSLQVGLAGADICINLATSLPGPSGRGDYAVNDRVRREGVPLLLDACGASGVQRLVQQSIAMVGASGDALFDETARAAPTGDDAASLAIRATLDMEDSVRASDLDWIILRGGLFYGPGTGFDNDWFARAAAGKLRLPEDGSDYVSLAHIADMADATVAALKAWPTRQTLIIADDTPAQWRDVFGYVAELAGAQPPAEGGRRGFPSFRASNALARQILNWAPRYRDYRMGLAR